MKYGRQDLYSINMEIFLFQEHLKVISKFKCSKLNLDISFNVLEIRLLI